MRQIPFMMLLTIVFFSAAVFAAEDAGEVKALLEKKINSVLDVLEQKDLEDREKRKKIEDIVDPVFNYELMAKLALGPRHWPRLSSGQKETFSARFIRRMKDSYFDKISMYSADSGADFTYGSPLSSNGKVSVPVTVRTGADRVEMIYRFYRSKDGWKVYDVELEGVSIIKSYRSQFEEVLSEGSIEDMLEDLKTPEQP